MSKELDTTLRLFCEGSSDIYFIGDFKDRVKLNHLRPLGEPTSSNPEGQGDSFVYKNLPVALKTPGVRSIGVVLDADTDKEAKWKRIGKILDHYHEEMNIPFAFPPIQKEGIVVELAKARFGLWFWPDNVRNGDLETLLEELIEDDKGYGLACLTVDRVLNENLSELESKDRRKAQIHTWLGFQKEPGRPFGQAVKNSTIGLFDADGKTLKNETLKLFKSWLQRLYTHD